VGGRFDKNQAVPRLSGGATKEISRFFREEHRVIIPITVREILDEQIAHKLA